MPDRHKSQPLRVRLPEDDRNWLLKYTEATGKKINTVLVAALREYRATRETTETTETTEEQQ